MMSYRSLNFRLTIFLLVAAMPVLALAGHVGRASGGGDSIQWSADVSGYHQITLRVSDPLGNVTEKAFASGKPISFSLRDLAGKNPVDGGYVYELIVEPTVAAGVKKQLADARAANDDAAAARILKDAGIEPMIQSGSFTVAGGSIVPMDAPESGAGNDTNLQAAVGPEAGPAGTSRGPLTPVVQDQVIPDDLIVQGSACVGLDCVNNENFGFDTIRLKENNLRIHFDDTSVSAGFPANDWRLIANDSASGGSSKFSIEDSTSVKTPFTITAGAATNSIFVDSTGRLGLRTSTPVLDLHINTANTPAIRLEQNNSGGFTAQTWDIGANEANFFVRDVTGGSRLSFRIRPGAPTSSIDISADGDVGIGTGSPSVPLHVLRTTGAVQEMILAANNNEARISIQNTGANAAKYITGVNNTNPALYFISRDGGGGTIVEVNQRLDGGGVASLKVNGSVQATNVVFASSRDLKNEGARVDGKETLARLAALPISEWTLKTDETKTKHIGPMAEDFYAAFGAGRDNKTISVTDANGVAMSAIQGLAQALVERDQEVAELKARLAELEKLVKPQE